MYINLVSTIIHKFWKTWQDYIVIGLLIALGVLLIFTILFGIFNNAKRDAGIRRTAKRNAEFRQRMEIEKQALILMDQQEEMLLLGQQEVLLLNEYKDGEYEVENEGEYDVYKN